MNSDAIKSVAIPTALVGCICGVLAMSDPKAPTEEPAAAPAPVVAPAPAEEDEGEYRVGTIAGYSAEALDFADKPDFIIVQGPKGEEEVSVQCSPFDWEATGPNTREFAATIAREWCF